MIEPATLLFLCLAAFAAGFIDAIVGGGGLIQTPMGLILLPAFPVAQVIGSLKIPAFCGTSLAAMQYMDKVKMHWKLLVPMVFVAAAAAFAGSALLLYVSNTFMKPLLLVVLLLLVVYTYLNKSFGMHAEKNHSAGRQIVYGILISAVIGFYDGFIGPGTGSFLVLSFIAIMGFDFLHASAHAKLVNLSTNLGSILLFLILGKILWWVALPMAACNAAGGWMGAKLAIHKGNKFIRIFFLIVVIATLIRFGYDVVMK
jgi:uncharacterized membrane protein YfcA